MADEIFREGIKRKGKGKANAKNRFKGLLIVSPYIIFRRRKKYGKMTATDMFLINKQYNILMK